MDGTSSAVGKRLFADLERFSQNNFTGRLDIRTGQRCWQLYLTLGRLTWMDGGVHPLRRWHRQVDRLDAAEMRTEAARLELTLPNDLESPAYGILLELIHTQGLKAACVGTILQELAQEALFDLLCTFERQNDYTLTDRPNLRPTGSSPLPHTWLPNLADILAAVMRDWSGWCERGLQRFWPNGAPVIVRAKSLQAKTSPATFQLLETLLDGRRTARDLAVAMERSLVDFVALLAPYVDCGWIAWREVADAIATPNPTPIAAIVAGVADLRADAIKTIAAVEDNPQILHLLEAIATSQGFRFVGIPDSLEALAILPDRQPDVIFIDAVMPVMNGYELCQAIRKLEALRETPVVILSGNLVDRVRAPLAGANACIPKPATLEQLLQAMREYSRSDAVPVKPVSVGSDTAPTGAKSIACVDDCKVTQKIVQTVVAKQGYRFLGISGSLAAIPSLLDFKPNLILLDLVLPIVDGYELCARLREKPALHAVPIVIFSGNPIDCERATAVGVTAYFNKPLTREKMRQVLAYLD